MCTHTHTHTHTYTHIHHKLAHSDERMEQYIFHILECYRGRHLYCSVNTKTLSITTLSTT